MVCFRFNIPGDGCPAFPGRYWRDSEALPELPELPALPHR